MSSIANVMREELARMAEAQVGRTADRLVRTTERLKTEVAELKKKVAILELTAKRQSIPSARKSMVDEEDIRTMRTLRPTSDMIKQLRKRLGVSQRELGLLLGVSTQAVYLWERGKGQLNLRDRARAALVDVRKLSPDEAHARLSGAGK